NQVYFVGTIGGVTYHPFYNNTIRTLAITTNHWYHIAAVRSGDTVSLYLDGVLEGYMPVSGAANQSNGSLSIGRYGDFAGDYFNGWIDNVDIAKGTARWTEPFSSSTIQTF